MDFILKAEFDKILLDDPEESLKDKFKRSTSNWNLKLIFEDFLFCKRENSILIFKIQLENKDCPLKFSRKLIFSAHWRLKLLAWKDANQIYFS